MKRSLILCIILLTLFSCESAEQKQAVLDDEIKEQQIIDRQKAEEIQEREILEKKRTKQKILEAKAIEDERKAQDELLSDSLIAETALMNKNALDLLNSESDISGGEGEYDLRLDDSITKFVNNTTSFNNLEYLPKNLVALEGEYIEDAKGNSQLRSEAAIALDNLAQNFYLEFTKNLKVVSAYRSYDYQKGIKDRGCSDTLCAKAGYSEHQSGLAVDFWEASTQKAFQDSEELSSYFEWMKKHAHKYGFTNTYQKGVGVDGYEIEPWHWRFVGEELALILSEYKVTFAEYALSPENY